MFIVNKDKDEIINIDTQCTLYISFAKDEIYTTRDGNFIVSLGEYERPEVTKAVFKMILEAIEKKQDIFYMPE